jgi:uncharacterized cofD-like protein
VTAERGSRVVAIGGGHGLATSIRAIRPYASHITAVVATADDGGSSGRLREAWDLPAPGDVRRCLAALADQDNLWTRLVERRFEAGDLAGHALGNLLLLALTEELGDFQAACDALAATIGVNPDAARVVPVTEESVVLKAMASGEEVEGQVEITRTTGIERVWVEPLHTRASRAAIDAVTAADQVVLGPGSLFTSVLAAAVVGDLPGAIAATDATRVYVCNVTAEVAETKGYDVAAHVDALQRHGIQLDAVLYQEAALPVGDVGVPAVGAQLVRPDGRAHDPVLLGRALAGLVEVARPGRT